MPGPQSSRGIVGRIGPVLAALTACGGCAEIPIRGWIGTQSTFQGQADIAGRVTATLEGPIEVRVPLTPDPGPMVAVPVRAGRIPDGARVGLIDVDGILLNQNPTGPYSSGENPVAAFREKLEAAARDPRVRSLIVRINSPGGGVTACDILADELRRFREATGKPTVACLMDLGTAGAYYLAVGADRVIAHPTTVTGGVGAILNHANLQDAMGQLNIVHGAVKSGPLVEMGSVTAPLDDDSAQLLQEMVNGFAARFRDRVAARRPAMAGADLDTLCDGRVIPAQRALDLKMIDRIGYIHEAIAEAERLSGADGAEIVLFQRQGSPSRSLYAITPNAPIQADMMPFSYPGLDRTKIPTFLYLWNPDPTMTRLGGR